MQNLELALKRAVKTDTSTIGKLSVDGKFLCFILEDKDRDLVQTMSADQIAKIKVYGQTAIPRGRYEVVLSMSKRFQRVMPEILNVPGYDGIRIHSGNKAADTLGCLLTGAQQAGNWVSESKLAFDALMSHLEPAFHNNQKIFITIA